MSTPPVVTLIHEINCYEDRRTWAEWWRDRWLLRTRGWVSRPGFASLWVMAGELGEDVEYADVARKLLGPVPVEHANTAMDGLRAALEAAGVRVQVVGTADD